MGEKDFENTDVPRTVKDVLHDNPDLVEQYREGDIHAMQGLIDEIIEEYDLRITGTRAETYLTRALGTVESHYREE